MDKYNVELTPGFEAAGAYHHVEYPNHNYAVSDGRINWMCCEDANKHGVIIQLIGDSVIGDLTRLHSAVFAKLAAMGYNPSAEVNRVEPWVECRFTAGEAATVTLRHYYHADITTWQYEQDITVLRGAGLMVVGSKFNRYHKIEYGCCASTAELFNMLVDRPIQRAALYAQARRTERLLAMRQDPAILLKAASELALAAKAMT